LLKDAPVLILDEATANVDPQNEQLLIQAIVEPGIYADFVNGRKRADHWKIAE